MTSAPDDPARFRAVEDPRPLDEPWPVMVWPPPTDVELSGQWVRARLIDPSADAVPLFAALDHDQVWAHLAERPTTAAQFAHTLQDRHERRGWYQWILVAGRQVGAIAAGEVVGVSCYLAVSPGDARLEIGSTAYTPAAWGTAVNPEAKLLLLGYAFQTLHAGRVQLKTDVRNARSQQAIARLGATYEGTLRRYQRRADESVRDTVLFSVTAEDWPVVRDRLRARISGAAGCG